PSHTTVVNHHLIKNKHVFPHTTSEKDTVESVDVAGNSFNGPGGMGSHHHHHHQHEHGHGKCHCKNKHKW
ncbi:MAG TPA: CotD family spore coat protein, partial [Virgibacillus sp.]|nr:CotD family spore coat protein [Virgibacillus sp.]